MKIFCFVSVWCSLCSGLFGQSLQMQFRHQMLSQEVPMTSATVPVADIGNEPAKKSPALGVLYSLILPGMGELYAGRFDIGRYSLIAEGACWLTYASWVQYGNWLRSDARQFAINHSGANPAGKDDNFYVNLASYNSVYDYNEAQLQARNIDGVYDPSAGYYWMWDSDNDRNQFHELRISSDRVLNNSKFIIGVIVVNHLLSAINAARLVRNFNRSVDDGLGAWNLQSSLLGSFGRPDGLQVTLIHRF
jgi:hypothetical protein